MIAPVTTKLSRIAKPPNWATALRCQRSGRGATTQPWRLQIAMVAHVNAADTRATAKGSTTLLAVIGTFYRTCRSLKCWFDAVLTVYFEFAKDNMERCL